MSEPNYLLGIDYGTESGRVMLVDTSNGGEVAWHAVPYSNGVLDRELPGGGALGPDFALQDPLDYLTVLSEGIPVVLRSAGIEANTVVGIGVDFTSCAVLPSKADGTPPRSLPEFEGNPHAWVKLWKHHAAATAGDAHQRGRRRARRRLHGTLRGRVFLGVVCLESPRNSRRGAGSLRGGRPLSRGRRLARGPAGGPRKPLGMRRRL